jgi:ATP-dependent DNA helicase HFM1/MER3
VDSGDRALVEQHYLKGDISVICCTSTLAVGVNLPCHMVIIKGTISYAGDGVCKELSELDVLQMMGRAGRPQFDTTAVSVILTRFDNVNRWEKLVSGEEILESR